MHRLICLQVEDATIASSTYTQHGQARIRKKIFSPTLVYVENSYIRKKKIIAKKDEERKFIIINLVFFLHPNSNNIQFLNKYISLILEILYLQRKLCD